jgi:hypothetical protein
MNDYKSIKSKQIMKTSIKYIFLICLAMASWHKAHAQTDNLKTLLNNGASWGHLEDFVEVDADNNGTWRGFLFGKPYSGTYTSGDVTGYIMAGKAAASNFNMMNLGYFNEANTSYNNFIQCKNLNNENIQTPVLTILSNSTVGIGNSNPNALLTVGADNASSTALKLDVHGSAHFNNDAGTTDATMTSVTINTDVNVTGCALTVAGPTYIGDWRTIEANKVKTSYINTYNLWVDKGIVSPDFIMTAVTGWADDVFTPGYKLPELKEVEQYIAENGHLSGIPSTAEVKEKGYSVGTLNRNLLRKVEELTLYAIGIEKKTDDLQQQVDEMNGQLKAELEQLKAGMKQ